MFFHFLKTLSTNEKQSAVKLLEEAIDKTVVRCFFRLSDNQESASHIVLHNSSSESVPDSNKEVGCISVYL